MLKEKARVVVHIVNLESPATLRKISQQRILKIRFELLAVSCIVIREPPLSWSDPCGQFSTPPLTQNIRQVLDKAFSHDNTDSPDLDKSVPELGFF